MTLAGVVPLFFKIAPMHRQKDCSRYRRKISSSGGLVSTLETTGQQWDAPNGWAPLQWMAIVGLENYGLDELAGRHCKKMDPAKYRRFQNAPVS